MTPVEQRIFDVIRADVCGRCAEAYDAALEPHSATCASHKARCYAGYERQAREICRIVVQPLEHKIGELV